MIIDHLVWVVWRLLLRCDSFANGSLLWRLLLGCIAGACRIVSTARSWARFAALRLEVMSARFLILVTPSILACESLLWIDNILASWRLTSGRFGGVLPGSVFRAAKSSKLNFGI